MPSLVFNVSESNKNCSLSQEGYMLLLLGGVGEGSLVSRAAELPCGGLEKQLCPAVCFRARAQSTNPPPLTSVFWWNWYYISEFCEQVRIWVPLSKGSLWHLSRSVYGCDTSRRPLLGSCWVTVLQPRLQGQLFGMLLKAVTLAWALFFPCVYFLPQWTYSQATRIHGTCRY